MLFLIARFHLQDKEKLLLKSKSNISMMILTRTMVPRKSLKNYENPQNVFLNAPLESICARWESKLNGLSLGLPPPVILFSAKNCITYLMSSLIQTVLMLYGVLISPTFELQMVLYALTVLWTYIPVKSLLRHLPIRLKYPQ